MIYIKILEEIIGTPHPALSLKGRGIIRKLQLCRGLFGEGGNQGCVQ